jgi:hypothetical protein
MQIERRVTWGNLLGLIPLLAAIIAFFAQGEAYKARTAENADAIGRHSTVITAHDKQLAEHSARLGAVERLANDRNADIIRRLDRIEDKLDQVPLR